LTSLSIDIIFNHDASNSRAKFFLNTGNCRAKKISFYHTDPLHGIDKIPDNIVCKIFRKYCLFLKRLRKKREINHLLNHGDKLVLLSEAFKKKLAKELNLKSPGIISINNPIQLRTTQDSIVRKKEQILFVGRLEKEKNPRKALIIWSKIECKYPDWEFIFLGDGTERTALIDLANSLKLKNVKFKGFVDTTSYYKESAVQCNTSDYEGFGLALIEGMQYGVVPITFNNWDTLKEIIVDNETGMLVKPNDEDEYSRKLQLLLNDRGLRKRISENVINHVKKFDIENVGPQWISLFRELVPD
jgi:glycosyltransferase involved in cell wall biosynthesis